MRAPLNALPPQDPKAFEELCWDLWRRLWGDPGAEMNGREGQPQAGVDVYGYPDRGSAITGIQCKVRSQLKGSRLTEQEVRNEVDSAKKFKPRLSQFLIATTSLRDSGLQEAVRELDRAQRQAKSFRVEVVSWDDILLYLWDHPDLIFKHLGYLRADAGLFHSRPLLQRVFSDPERQALLEALESLPSLGDEARRNRIFEALRFSTSHERLELSGLLEVSLRRTEGLETLVDVLARFEDPEHLQPVLRCLDGLVHQPIHRTEVHQVKSILLESGIPDSVAFRLFRRVQPFATVPTDDGGGPLLSTLIDLLAKKPHRPPTEAPLLQFLEGCSGLISDDEIKAELQEWMEGVAARLGCELAPIQARAASLAPEPEDVVPDKAVLLVKFTPDLGDEQRTQIAAWVTQGDTNDVLLPVSTPEESQPTRDLEAVFGELFRSAHPYLKDPFAQPTVELVLPIQLLHECDMHGWKVPLGKRSRGRVGGHCPVVTRSYERIYDPDFLASWPLWRKKWELRPREMTAENVFWLDTGELFEGDLYATLQGAGSVVAARASTSESAVELENVETLLDSGIPIALLARNHAGPAGEVEPALRGILCCDLLDQLPQRLQEQRGQSSLEEAEVSLWDHVTLLWDTPERLPPDVHFRRQAPQE